jgi:copper chaperone CopZ
MLGFLYFYITQMNIHMKNIFFLAIFSFIFGACGTEAAPAIEQDESVAKVEPNTQLTMEVDGMSCKMNCGGSIRKSLIGTGGVSTVEFDFEAERATNVATITFDKNLVSVDEMIKAVAETNNGLFTVGETSSAEYHESTPTQEDQSSSSEESKVEVSSSRFEMPNLIDLFSGLLFQ